MGRKPSAVTKADTITVRLHPRIRFALEIAARRERRALSTVVENFITQGIKNDAGIFEYSTEYMLEQLWHPDESERFINLATEARNLLDYEEERKWKAIEECPIFWKEGKTAKKIWSGTKSALNLDEIRKHWELLEAIGKGELGFEALPK